MLRLDEVDSSKLLYDIHSPTFEEDIRKGIPDFGDYVGEHAKKVFQYIVLMYDIKTPMHKEAPDYFQRKYVTASMVGMPKNKQGFTEETESILLGKDNSVNVMITAYLFQFNKPEYMSLMLYDAILGVTAQRVMKGDIGKDTSKLIEDATKRKQELTRDVFGSGAYDEYSMLRNALYARIEKEKVRLRPEQIIRDFETSGQLPDDFCPHGADAAGLLRVVKMNFVGDKPPRKRGRPKKQV